LNRLWRELIRTGQKLGFTWIRFSCAHGERTWSESIGCETTFSVRHVLHGHLPGVLELKAPQCPPQNSCKLCPKGLHCAHFLRPGIGDETLFEITSELLTEGWIKALTRVRIKRRIKSKRKALAAGQPAAPIPSKQAR